MPRDWTRRSVVLGSLALTTGCLRTAEPEETGEETTASADENTSENDDAGGGSGGEETTTTTGPDPTEAAFAFDYVRASDGPELRVVYSSGPTLDGTAVTLAAAGGSETWSSLTGGAETLEPGDTATLAGGLDGGDWPLRPTQSVELRYQSDDGTTRVGQFNTGGAAESRLFEPSNSGRNADVVGGASAEVAWTRTVDRVVNQPAVRDGVVYYGTYDRHFHARSLETGETLWTFDAPAPDITDDDATIATTPAVTEDAVYIGPGNSAVGFRLDRETGEVEWERADIGMYSPTVVDGSVYVGGGSGVTAVDAETGEVKWQKDIGWVSDGAMAVADGRVLAAVDTGIVCLSADTGEEQWVFFGGDLENPANPSAADGTVFAAAGAGGGQLVALDLADGSKQWTVDTGASLTRNTPLVGREAVFVLSDSMQPAIVAVDQSDGTVRWNAEDGGAGTAGGSNGALYHFASTGGVAARSQATGDRLWTLSEDDAPGPGTPIAVADGFLVYASRIGDEQYQMVALRERT
jgi:outer membrane protein assembly factor BamB